MPLNKNHSAGRFPFLQGGGEMGELIRSVNWASNPLGSPEQWPLALKVSVGTMLASNLPTLICWGNDFIQLYNDAFRPINGASKHPQAMGGPAQGTFAEIWDTIGPMFTGVMRGEKFSFPDLKVALNRNGYVEDCYFNFSYSPIVDENGNTGGVLVICIETTAQVLALEQFVGAKEELATINEELTATNEELAAANEEGVAMNEVLSAKNDELSDTYKILAQSQEDLVFTIKAAGVGTFDYNPVTNKFTGNEVLKSWFGLSAAQELDLSKATNVIAEKDRDRVVQAIQTALNYSSAGKYDIEYTIANPNDPVPRIVHAKGQALFNEANQPVRLSGILQDITDEKYSTAALEEAREQFSLLADNISQLAWMTDHTGYIFWYNKRWFDYTGTTLEEMQGWGWEKVQHPDHFPRVLEKWVNNIKTGEIFEMTFPLRSKDGEFRWFLTRAVPLKDDNGNIVRWFGTNTDITEQRADEQRKNDFIGMVSHELKTPLTSLTAIIQVAKHKLVTSDDSFLSGAMEKAATQVRKMSNMINGFLNVSRLESGKLLISKQEFTLDGLVKEIISEHQLTVSTHIIEMNLCDHVHINADRDKIGSVISNLLSNAVKYSPKGKQIKVSCRLKSGYAEVSVHDFGMGINEADLDHVFDRFYRVQTSDTQHISGFGIGLYLSAEIIKHHGGKIWVDSEVGAGSTFYFSLPLK